MQNDKKITQLDQAVQNLIEMQPVQPIVFTPNPDYPTGRIYTRTEQLREWPIGSPEYRMITSLFQKVGHGTPVLLQSVPNLKLCVAGLIENGQLNVYGMNAKDSMEAVDTIMEWFLQQVKDVVNEEESK